MKPEIKTEWLEALKSGEYPKGENYLAAARGGGTMNYCCLGVLCEIAIKNGLDLDVEDGVSNGNVITRRYYNDASSFLPLAVAQWAGIEPESDADDEDDQSKLANLNDDADSFEPVIAYIEENM